MAKLAAAAETKRRRKRTPALRRLRAAAGARPKRRSRRLPHGAIAAGKKRVSSKLLRLRRKKRLSRRLLRRAGRRVRLRRSASLAAAARAAAAAAGPAVELAPVQPAAKLLPDGGVNLIGFLRSEIGLGESVRLAARSLTTANVPFGILDYKEAVSEGMGDTSWAHKEIAEPLYRANVFHMNADAMPHLHRFYGHSLWHDRYNIGVWHWELPEFPVEFMDGFDYVQELWAPSRFIQQVMEKVAAIPVVYVPHGVEVTIDPNKNRDYFALPHDRFLFYMMYDAQSHTLRKNPLGAIQAFTAAFGKDDPSVGLVLKVNNRNVWPQDFAPIAALIEGRSNVFLIDQVMRRIDVNSLLNATDCYVSLHRAEGFGLGLAEAMYLGKPVIGTNWSGNIDFMNERNSCPVSYRLVPVGLDWAAYRAHQIWAEPDLAQAAAYMKKLVQDRRWAQQIALEGQQTIRTAFSPAVSGERMKQRLAELGCLYAAR
ncbi:glycosyltransferase [Paenibacillus cymbidii]|uniref:glycosyltransferase n=1 Tax=Paenibacillus cymbidii TaxID=1639034 RepID=UPI0010811364|nr:glycosyltransferase [Paenibacillus cymbidii]